MELAEVHGTKPLVEVDGKPLKANYGKYGNVVKALGKALGRKL